MNTYINKIRRSVGFNYERNTALRLVLSLGGFYIGLHALYIVILVLSKDQSIVFQQIFLPEIALSTSDNLIQKPWTIISHALFHKGFWEFITNMVWLYLFSNIIQSLVGYKEIVPIYIISCLIAALGILGIDHLFAINGNIFLAGSYPAILAMAMACLVLAPTYRIYISERFSFPTWIPIIVYITLNILTSYPQDIRRLVWMVIGGLVGVVYMLLLKNGYAIGKGIYQVMYKIFGSKSHLSDATHPSASKQLTNKEDKDIDAILDKIHKKGMLSLSNKEKDTLEAYGKKL
jgi:membrane associated rhomboid family serine protease